MLQTPSGQMADAARQACPRRTVGGVGRRWKGRLPAKTTKRDNTLAVLWYAIVRGVDLTQMDTVPDLDERCE